MQLYQRLLGASFARLPPALQRFHGRSGGTARFAFEVTHGRGLLREVAARAMRLPAAAALAPGRLVVTVRGDREIWERTFPDLTLRTVQSIDGGHLVEDNGPVRFIFQVDADERGMRMASIGCRVFGRPVPTALAPYVWAEVRGRTDGWDAAVSIALPRFGPIVSYGGPVTTLP